MLIKERLASAEMAHVNLQEKLLEVIFIGKISDVEIISELHELKDFVMAEDNQLLSSLQKHFLTFSDKRGHYDQIRFRQIISERL